MELTEDYKKEVVGPIKSKRVFIFGNGGQRRSEGKYIIPTDINGQRRTLELDVIRADIPLLLSTAEMKNLDMAVDMTREEIRIMGETKKLILTEDGLPAMRLQPRRGSRWDRKESKEEKRAKKFTRGKESSKKSIEKTGNKETNTEDRGMKEEAISRKRGSQKNHTRGREKPEKDEDRRNGGELPRDTGHPRVIPMLRFGIALTTW